MSKKSRDKNGRWRSRTVAFRASDAENASINELVALSGLTKQDYLISRVLNRDIVVYGNPRVFKALKERMNEIYSELVRLSSPDDVNEELSESIKLVAKLCSELNRERNE